MAKYWKPKALAGPTDPPGLVPAMSRDSTGFLPGFTAFSDPRLRGHKVLCFFLTKDGFIDVETVPGQNLGDVYATNPDKLILAVTALHDLARRRLLESFVRQKVGDLYSPTSKVLAYLRRHGADFEKPGESSYVRYTCTCSKGFTRVYNVPGVPVRCQKCERTTGLAKVECTV